MTSPIAIYTCVTGGHDSLKEQPPIFGVDYLAWADSPLPNTRTWQTALLPGSDESDRMRAKHPKARPDLYARGYDLTIWVDGSIQILDGELLVDTCLAALQDDIAMFAHPDRDCVYTEAAISRSMSKYDPAKIDAHVEALRTARWPEHAGLWACGVIARKRGPRMNQLGEQWLAVMRRWSDQDQLSLPPLLDDLEISPGTIPGNLWDNPLIRVGEHRRPE